MPIISEPFQKKLMGKRFCEFRKAINKSQSELAKELKLNQSAISLMENGAHRPTWSTLLYLIDKYSLNVQWLIAGKGPMFVTSGTVFMSMQNNPEYRKMLEEMDTDTDLMKGVLLRYSELKKLRLLDKLKELEKIDTD